MSHVNFIPATPQVQVLFDTNEKPAAQLTNSTPYHWIKDLCKRIYDLAMKMINTIKNYFTSKQNKPIIDSVSTTTNGPTPRNILPFYRGLESNNNGVTLQQILDWNDEQLEAVHNYIQWLFPLKTPSRFNHTDPVLDQATIEAFCNSRDLHLKNQLLHSFRRMLSFYGLQMNEATCVITRAPNFNARAAVWLTPDNHNYSRITRMICSLSILGQPEYAQAFKTIMLDIASHEGSTIISTRTLRFWQSAGS
jgi:hypothetical protein